MYFVTINGLINEKLLKNIYNNIDCFGISNKMFILYKFNFKKVKAVNKKLLANAFIVDLNELEELSESETEDIILDLIELNANILLKPYSGKNKDFKLMIYSVIKDFGLKFLWYKPFDFKKKIDLRNLSFNDYQTILEIFEEPIDTFKFNNKMFVLKYEISDEGKVYDRHSNQILDLNKELFVNIITKPYDGLENLLKSELKTYTENNIFSTDMYEPFPFVFEEKDINKKIIRYKYMVFEALKNIRPEDYPDLPKELTDMLNKNGYIQFDDILKAIGA